MAKRVKELPEPKKGRPQKYPWDEWQDGSVWEVITGVDVELSPQNFATILYRRAKETGMSVETRQQESSVTFQFFDKKNSRKKSRK